MNDKDRLDWLEKQHTLHKSIEFTYVVSGYTLEFLYDGNVVMGWEGQDIRECIDRAMAEQK